MVGTSYSELLPGQATILNSDKGNPVMYFRYPGTLETPSGILEYRDIREIENPEVGRLGHKDLLPVVWDGTDWISQGEGQ